MKAKLNESMMTNRRYLAAPITEQEVGRMAHASALSPAAVAYLFRWQHIILL